MDLSPWRERRPCVTVHCQADPEGHLNTHFKTGGGDKFLNTLRYSRENISAYGKKAVLISLKEKMRIYKLRYLLALREGHKNGSFSLDIFRSVAL